jgi:glycosyltransferase involved in cell wall biosynthesis
MDFLPREQLSRSLVNCDAALISLRAGLEGVAVPSKLYGILAAGRAVVAQVPSGSEVALAIVDADCGFVVQPGDAQGLAIAIRGLATDRQVTADMGKRARDAYLSTYTIENAAENFVTIWGLEDAPVPR